MFVRRGNLVLVADKVRNTFTQPLFKGSVEHMGRVRFTFEKKKNPPKINDILWKGCHKVGVSAGGSTCRETMATLRSKHINFKSLLYYEASWVTLGQLHSISFYPTSQSCCKDKMEEGKQCLLPSAPQRKGWIKNVPSQQIHICHWASQSLLC